MGVRANVTASRVTTYVNMGFQSAAINQAPTAVAIGAYAGQTDQGGNCVAIGAYAGQTSQTANSIVLNASGSALNSATSGFFVKPVRSGTGGDVVCYDPLTFEVFSSTGLDTSVITTGVLGVARGGSGTGNNISWLVQGYNAGAAGAYSTTISGTNSNKLPNTAYHQSNVTVASNVQVTVPIAGYYQLNLDAIQPSGANGSLRALLALETIDATNGTLAPEIVDLFPTSGVTNTVWSGFVYLLANTKLRPYIHAASGAFYNYVNFSGFLVRAG